VSKPRVLTEDQYRILQTKNALAKAWKPGGYLRRNMEGEMAHNIAVNAPKRIKQPSKGEEMLAFQLKLAGITGWVREYKFHPTRRWKVDFAWCKEKFAVEIEGGQWTQGRHQRGQGFADDMFKYNSLSLAGWRLLRFTTEMVTSGHAVSKIQLALMS